LDALLGAAMLFILAPKISSWLANGTLNAVWELGGHHLLPVNLAPVDNERSVANSVNRALLLACGIDVCGDRL